MPSRITDALIRKLRLHMQLEADDVSSLELLPFEPEELPANTFVAKEGDEPTRCCLIVDGFMFRAKATEDGKRQILSFHVPGDIPDLQNLHLHVSDHDLVTLTAAILAFVSHDAMHQITRARPRLAAAFWRETLVDAAMFREWIVNVGRRPAPARMAHLLAELASRLDAVGLKADGEFYLPLSQVHLADALGLTSVHVNRVLQELRKDGVLEFRNHTLRLGDAKRLEAAGAFDPLYLHQSPRL